MSEKRKIAKSASLISFATFISRILGFVRDIIIARFFGATGLSDTFFVAFRIPNMLRELLAEGSMSSALIPVLTEWRTKKGGDEAGRLVRIVFTFIIIFVGSLCVLGILFAPLIITVIAPGFVNEPAKFQNTVMLTRIMFPFLLFVSLSALVMGALNTRKVFFIPSLASAWFNVAIITMILIFYSLFEEPLTVVAIGVTVGGMFQFISQLPTFFKRDYSLKFDFHFLHSGLRKIGLLILPATMGMAVAQLNIFISTVLASFLPSGSITYLYYSMRLIQFPIGIFGVAMGMAVLPALSEYASKKDFESLREEFSFSLRLLFSITIPSMIGLICLREPIVNLLFQRGEFDYAATQGTSTALLFYSMGIWAIVGVRMLTSTFYSMQDTKTPVKVAVAALTMNIILSLLLMKPLLHGGLALANATASSINFLLLFFFLKKKLKRVDTKRILNSFMKVTFASIIMGMTGWLFIQGRQWIDSGDVLTKSIYLFFTILSCVFIYFVTALLLKSEEVRYILKMVWRK